jgi:hypothetical protein
MVIWGIVLYTGGIQHYELLSSAGTIICWCYHNWSICMLELLLSNAIKGQFEWKLVIFFALSNLSPISSQFPFDSPYKSSRKTSDAGIQKYIIWKLKICRHLAVTDVQVTSPAPYFSRHNNFILFFFFVQGERIFVQVRKAVAHISLVAHCKLS